MFFLMHFPSKRFFLPILFFSYISVLPPPPYFHLQTFCCLGCILCPLKPSRLCYPPIVQSGLSLLSSMQPSLLWLVIFFLAPSSRFYCHSDSFRSFFHGGEYIHTFALNILYSSSIPSIRVFFSCCILAHPRRSCFLPILLLNILELRYDHIHQNTSLNPRVEVRIGEDHVHLAHLFLSLFLLVYSFGHPKKSFFIYLRQGMYTYLLCDC